MDVSQRLPRSPQLMSRHDSALLVVDVQTKLLELIPNYEKTLWNIQRLIDGANVLGVPVAATEQYPKGLGPTHPSLASRLGTIPSKSAFSCAQCADIFRRLADEEIHNILVVGIEAHVCVLQTAMDLMSDGFDVYLAVDAIAARFQLDCDVAMRRLDSAGASLTTTETVLFEWCDTAESPEFKQISELVRRQPPLDDAS